MTMSYPVIAETANCLKQFVLYIIPCVIVLLIIKFCTKVPKFIFRKLLHLVAFTCVILMLMAANDWYAASIASLLIAAVIYPVLALAEKGQWFADLFIEKRPGEIKRSLILLFTMFAALTAVGWGIFGGRMITAAAILMWGVGDASAAIVGIPFGKHKVHIKPADGKKSWEGTVSMFLSSFVSGAAFLLFYANMPTASVVWSCALGAFVGATTELFSPSEWDTVTVPAVILIVLLLF